MNEKIRHSFYYIFLFCFFLGTLLFVKVDSYAETSFTVTCNMRVGETSNYREWSFPSTESNRRFCFYNLIGQRRYILCSNMSGRVNFDFWGAQVYPPADGHSGSSRVDFSLFSNLFEGDYTFYGGVLANTNYDFTYNNVSDSLYNFGGLPAFSELSQVEAYLSTGELPYDETLKLLDFKVWDYGVSDLGLDYTTPEYSTCYKVTWNDSRITTVRVRIDSTLQTQDFLDNSSPMNGKFRGGDYAALNGDTITLTATPYDGVGHYGESLTYSFVWDDNSPLTNLWRKLFKTNHYNNTIEVPYTPPSSEPTTVELPVSGVTTNKVYRVNYNPTTNTYEGDSYLVDIYYSPVIIYPSDTPTEEITTINNYVSEEYVTNNYYETTKDVDLDFNLDIDNVTNQDIENAYDDAGNFLKGFGDLVGKLAQLLVALFPFLTMDVASVLVSCFGLLLAVAVIVLFIKILKLVIPGY